jgi:hypothetical protein
MDVDAMDHGCGCSLFVLPAYLVAAYIHTYIQLINQSINQSIDSALVAICSLCPPCADAAAPEHVFPSLACSSLQPHSSPTVCQSSPLFSSRLQRPLSAPACAGICAVYKSHYLSETPVATQSSAPAAALPTLSDCHRPPKLQCPPSLAVPGLPFRFAPWPPLFGRPAACLVPFAVCSEL